MLWSSELMTRVQALVKKAEADQLSDEDTRNFVSNEMDISVESARRYINALKRNGVPEEAPADPVEVRRHKIRADEAARQLKALEERLVKAEDIRGDLMGLGPLKVSKLKPDQGRPSGRRAVILHISDIQYGEVIDHDAIDGINSYDMEIANRRIRRYFQKAHRFITELWLGEPPEEIVILLNGDMISGSIHMELAKTDFVGPMQQAQLVSEQLVAGIQLIADAGFPVRVISTPGNHGRTTMKPESKDHTLENYDTLVAANIEKMFRQNGLVTVEYSKSVDALFNVFAFPMLVTHGDRIGSRGGMGFQGPLATIVRGHAKVMADYAARGTHLYKIFTGHFHTPGVTSHGYANGTTAGASEYSRDGRMHVTPPSQDYLVIHEDHGVIEHRVILVGDPSEGSSCSPVLKYR